MIRRELVPFARLGDVGRYGKRAKPLDDQGIISGAKRERGFRAAGVSGTLEQKPRGGEIPVVEQILPALDQSDDFFVVERNLRPIGGRGSGRLRRRIWRRRT